MDLLIALALFLESSPIYAASPRETCKYREGVLCIVSSDLDYKKIGTRKKLAMTKKFWKSDGFIINNMCRRKILYGESGFSSNAFVLKSKEKIDLTFRSRDIGGCILKFEIPMYIEDGALDALTSIYTEVKLCVDIRCEKDYISSFLPIKEVRSLIGKKAVTGAIAPK